MEKITENIYRLTTPYKGIYTTICIIRTENGALLFDTGSYDSDIPEYILPFLSETGITADELKYIFISHAHADHAGGLYALMAHFPGACILSRSASLRERFAAFDSMEPEDGAELLGVLKCVAIPGHTQDSAAILDTRTGTLISGDCLQLYGIFGSGKWGANISYPSVHIEALEKLRGMEINAILAAHDYHPCGHIFTGAAEVNAALDACVAPLKDILALIDANPGASDAEIAGIYNGTGTLPVIGEHVAAALRRADRGLILR